MADVNVSNDDKQLTELKLVNLVHAIGLRKHPSNVEHFSIWYWSSF